MAKLVQIHLPNWKGTFVPESLLPQLLKDYEALGLRGEPYINKVVEEASIDLPGACSLTRSYVTVPVEEGFNLSIPSTDAEFFLTELESINQRFFPDGTPYFKLHGWLHCVVLAPAQRQTVIAYLRDNLEAIKKTGRAERQVLEDALAGAEKAGKLIRVRAEKNDPIPAGTPLSGLPNRERN